MSYIHKVYRLMNGELMPQGSYLNRSVAIDHCLDHTYCVNQEQLDGNLYFPHAEQPKENIVVFYSSKNRKGKHDATGAFIPESKRFANIHDVPKDQWVGIDCINQSGSRRYTQVMEYIKQIGEEKPITTLAFYCHGWAKGNQFGFHRSALTDFAALLSASCPIKLKIALYACSNAENDTVDWWASKVGQGTDGGFADVLRDEMARQGISRGRVDAHKTVGHVTENPYVVRFSCSSVEDSAKGGQGGAWLVEPRSENWSKWITALRATSNDLRHQFPFMSQAEVMNRLDQ